MYIPDGEKQFLGLVEDMERLWLDCCWFVVTFYWLNHKIIVHRLNKVAELEH